MSNKSTLATSSPATPPDATDREQRWSGEFTAREEKEHRSHASVGWMAENANYALEGNRRLLEQRQQERGTSAENMAKGFENRKERFTNFKAANPPPNRASSSREGTDSKRKFVPHSGPSRFGPRKKKQESEEVKESK